MRTFPDWTNVDRSSFTSPNDSFVDENGQPILVPNLGADQYVICVYKLRLTPSIIVCEPQDNPLAEMRLLFEQSICENATIQWFIGPMPGGEIYMSATRPTRNISTTE
jgi:hypothetical protein